MPLILCAWRPPPVATAAPVLGALLGLLIAVPCASGRPVRGGGPDKATSSRAARRESVEAMPLEQLDRADLEKVRFVLNNTTVYRRMPIKQIDCDPHLFLFFVRHPEVLVNIWEVLGVSNVSLRRTGDNTFAAGDGQGTLGAIKILHDQHDRQLIYAEGTYEGPLLKWPVRGKCVLLLQAHYHRDRDGRYRVTARLDSFTHIDRVAVELLAKTFQPLIGLSADYNFVETMAFVGDLSRATQRNPRGVERLYEKLTNVDPETRQQLLELTQNVAVRSTDRRAVRHSRPLKLVRRTGGALSAERFTHPR